MADAPVCRKCDRHHWPFVKCGEVMNKPGPHVVRAKRADGLKGWGDRFSTLVRQGESLLQQRKTPLQTGNLRYPEGFNGPEKED